MRMLIVLVALLGASPAVAQSRRAVPHAAQSQQPVKKRHEIPATGVLGSADLVAIARLKAETAEDQFSDDPTLPYVGRQFMVDLPASTLTRKYDRDSHSLTVLVEPYTDAATFDQNLIETAVPGQNAYGAKATIARTRGDSYGVWLPGQGFFRKTPVEYSTVVEGAVARDLSPAIRLRIYGQVVKADGVYAQKGSTVFKKSLIVEPTVSSPMDFWINEWLVAVAISRAEWIDSRTGAILGLAEFQPS